jgi:hypothetical protein
MPRKSVCQSILHEILKANDDSMGLGLTRDHQLPCPEHLSIWQDFNITWLALCQRHIDIGRIPGTGGSLLKRDQLENIAWMLIEICDLFEPVGLVDYEIGVWEEEILSGEYYLESSFALVLSP